MGKKIDRFALNLMIAAGFYFYFYRSFRNHIVAIALAFLCSILLGKLLQGVRLALQDCKCFRKRRIRRQASGAVMRLACMPQEEAMAAIQELLKESYGEEYEIELVQTHPSLKLSEQQIFEFWRRHQAWDQLVICSTCSVDSHGRMLASSLKAPKLAIVDADALEQLICEHPDGLVLQEAPKLRRKLGWRRTAQLFLNRKNAPKNLLFSLFMLLMYVLSGNLLYLFAALGLMFLALVSLRQHSRPHRLF